MQTTFLRRALLGAALLAGLAQQAGATITTVTGDTTGGPTWDRIDENPGNWPFNPTYPGTTYRAFDINVLEYVDNMNFATTCTFDCSMYIYVGAFDAAAPTENFLFGTGYGATDNAVYFYGPLDVGHYTILVTGENAAYYGAFSTTVSTVGIGTFEISPINPVPEPSTWLMLGAGLAGLGVAARRRPVAHHTAD